MKRRGQWNEAGEEGKVVESGGKARDLFTG
jgi:hypothetical protein